MKNRFFILATLIIGMFALTALPILPVTTQVASALTAKDCKSDEYFVAAQGKAGPGQIAAKCVKKAEQPRSAADCPSGTTYKPAGPAGPGQSPAQCTRDHALTASDCTADQYFVAAGPSGTVTNDAKCVDKSDQPRSASDCPTGTTYQSAQSVGGSTAKCVTSANTSDASDNVSEPGLSCKVKFYNPLTWLLCPAVKGMVNIVGQLDNIISSELSVGSPGNSDDPSQIFCNDNKTGAVDLKAKDGSTVKSCDAYHQAWATVRNIALGLMVIAGLIVLIAQALGMEILDAYTIKKVLPRILIAAIAITLSWQLMQFFVRLTNDLGYGVRWLIYQPFGGLSSATLGGGGVVAAGLVSAGAILALGIFGLLSFAATAALAVFIAFMVLIIREMLIIVLVIFAPIAIVAYILPNTQRVYKLWWDSFAKALLMFPLIAAFIAAGRVFAVVANNGTAIGQLIGFAAYFAPYFLLPLAFRFAGGALRGIGGFVNDRGRGGFDRLRKYRGNKLNTNLEAMQNSRRFNPNRSGALGYINRKANTSLANITSPGAAAKIYGGSALRKAGIENSLGMGIINQIDQTAFAHSQKLGQKMNEMGFNDKALRTLMEMDDWSAGNIRAKAAELSASSDASSRIAGSQLSSSATFLAQNLYSDAEMRKADIGVAAGLAVTSQGFSDTEEVAAVANRVGGTSRGLASAFVTQAQLNGQRAGRLDMKPGYGIQIGEDGKYFGTGLKMDDNENIDVNALNAKSPEERNRAVGHQIKRILSSGQQDFQTAKAPSVKAMSPGFQQLLAAEGSLPRDANGDYVFEYLNENNVTEQVKFSPNAVKRIAAMIGTAQTDYSGTSPQTHAALQDVVDSSRLSGDALAAYQTARRSGDEAQRRAGGPPEPPAGAEEPK